MVAVPVQRVRIVMLEPQRVFLALKELIAVYPDPVLALNVK